MTASLSRVMANIGGSRPCVRCLLLRAAESIMLYGAEVGADSMRYEMYRKRLAAVQRRGALRVACSYGTFSEAAILVIAGVIPVDLLAKGQKYMYMELYPKIHNYPGFFSFFVYWRHIFINTAVSNVFTLELSYVFKNLWKVIVV